MTDNIAQLSPTETDVLRLLAAGHTVKSIAAQMGRSEGSINERLREARRKTGAASSRELARRVVAAMPSQENRDQFIDLPVEASNVLPATTPSPASHRAWWIGGTIMALGLVLAGALALGGVPGAGPSVSMDSGASDAALAGFTPTGEPDFYQYEQKFQSEPRDKAWASASEHLLSNHFEEDRRRLKLQGNLNVRCGNTLCRVTGKYTNVESGTKIRQVRKTLQFTQLGATFASAKLNAEYVGGWDGNPPGDWHFVVYFRKVGEQPK